MNDTRETVRRLRAETSTLRAKVRDMQASLTELAPAPHAGVASGTEGEKGTELRPCDLGAAVARAQLSYALETIGRLLRERDKAMAERDEAEVAQERESDARDKDFADFENAVDIRDAEIKANRRSIAGLTTERDDLRIRLAERDAQVTALMRRLNEGLG